MNHLRWAAIAVTALLPGCGGGWVRSPAPWLSASADARAPAIFAPGVISSPLPEFSITFTPDGRTLYFNRASADRSLLTIMTSALSGEKWSEPVVAPFSGRYRDVDPFVTPDGTRLYFSSDRPRPASSVRLLSTWYMDRTPNGWSEPIHPGPPLNSDSVDVFVSVARDGTMLFSSRRDGALQTYTSRYANGSWEQPRPVRFGSVQDAGNPLISPSGRFAIFVQGQGQHGDLFVSCRTGSGWAEPRPLAASVNSAYADFAPALDPRETTLYFTSERPGIVGALPDSVRPPGDIYRIGLAAAGVGCK